MGPSASAMASWTGAPAAATACRGGTAPIIDALSPDSGVTPVADPFARVAWSNRSTESDIKDKGISAEVNWITPWFGESTLTSITAQRNWDAINGLDFNYTSADILYRPANEDESLTAFDTFTQEFRLTGATESVDWMVGMFDSDEGPDRNESYRIGGAYEPYLATALLSLVNPVFGQQPNAPLFLADATGRAPGTVFAGLGALDQYRQNAKSLALFTNNTWHATDALDLTLGLRFTREDKEVTSTYSNPNGSPGCSAMLGPGGQQRIAAALLAPGGAGGGVAGGSSHGIRV